MHEKEAGTEFVRISEITRLLSDQANDLSFPYKTLIGDDAAVINFQELKLNLFASDMMVENIHFRTSYFKEADIGYKSMATNVSDMAAMGGYPRYATVSLACPRHFSIKEFYVGIKAACEEYGFHIAGGDLSYSEAIVVSVAMLGACYGEPLLRSTARSGDYIFVTGPLGGSATGLELLREDSFAVGPLVNRHLRPSARLKEAKGISMAGATSAIDVSDGLVADLNHICEDSGLGALLIDIPVALGASTETAMYGGEDYELIFSHSDPDRVESVFASLGLDRPLVIGRMTSHPGITFRGEEIDLSGYQHDL